jgi:hypothetical protein
MGPAYEIELFERTTWRGKRYFFRCRRIGNGEIIFPSQAYRTKLGRDRTAHELARVMKAPISQVPR